MFIRKTVYCTSKYPSWLSTVKVLFPVYCSSTASYSPPLSEPPVPTVVLGAAVGCDVYTPGLPDAMSLVPSADDATVSQAPAGADVGVQVTPEFMEVYIAPWHPPKPVHPPPPTATSLVPSADEATDAQFPAGADVLQVTPESDDAYIPSELMATSLVPSADEATARQNVLGADVWIQVTPASGDV